MGLHDFLLALLIVAAIVFLIVAVVVMIRLLRLVDSMRNEFIRFGDETAPLIRKLHEVAEQAEHSFSTINQNADTIRNSVQAVKTIVDNVYNLHDLLYQQVAPSVTGLASTLAGIRRGLQAFIDRLRQPV